MLLALRSGERSAFDVIYSRYWQLLFENAMRRVGDEDQAKDIVQDVFVSMWDNRQKVEVVDLKAYLLAAVRNQVFSLIARDKVSDKYFKYLESTGLPVSTTDFDLHYNELLGQYDHLVARMPNKQKQIFQLRFDEGLPTALIADQLNITQKTVQNQLLKAVHFIKSALFSLILFL
ncbi:sigma-70 family RNA polymerase sigma factor [Dyadobacter sp. 676]|uniref:Sigma-70 family RNA polymerase sigma factor n=1 Tax=Dyadobacter sp. 676 TaxID=3088362 RepID=A0AAU8FGI0_9BACT